jgi:hypothetical protein
VDEPLKLTLGSNSKASFGSIAVLGAAEWFGMDPTMQSRDFISGALQTHPVSTAISRIDLLKLVESFSANVNKWARQELSGTAPKPEPSHIQLHEPKSIFAQQDGPATEKQLEYVKRLSDHVEPDERLDWLGYLIGRHVDRWDSLTKSEVQTIIAKAKAQL